MAIALVVLYHSAFHVSDQAPLVYVALARNGDSGVKLFFAISGFVLALPFARHWLNGAPAVAIRKYVLRRLWRLEPPYLVNLLICFVLKGALAGHRWMALAPHLAASAVYQHNLVFAEPSSINFFAWSLEIELQFYLIAPVLARVFFSIAHVARRRLLLGSTLALLGLTRIVFPIASDSTLHWTLLAHLEWFVVGIVLVEVYLVVWQERRDTSLAWDLISIPAWLGLFVLLDLATPNAYWSRLADAFAPWLVLVAYMAAFSGTWSRRILTWPPIYLVGGMCYSIYLYHGIILREVDPMIARLMLRFNWYAVFVAGGALEWIVILAVCSTLYLLFERPFMRPRTG